jgi:hypothetical protein
MMAPSNRSSLHLARQLDRRFDGSVLVSVGRSDDGGPSVVSQLARHQLDVPGVIPLDESTKPIEQECREERARRSHERITRIPTSSDVNGPELAVGVHELRIAGNLQTGSEERIFHADIVQPNQHAGVSRCRR